MRGAKREKARERARAPAGGENGKDALAFGQPFPSANTSTAPLPHSSTPPRPKHTDNSDMERSEHLRMPLGRGCGPALPAGS